MNLTLESAIVQQVLLDQLKDANENRYYLMAVIKQLEKNHEEQLTALEEENIRLLERNTDLLATTCDCDDRI